MSVYIYRLSQWLEKKFNAKGGNVITDLDQSARAVLPLNIGVEERYLQGWNRFSVNAQVSALAANFGRVRIRNPVNSNVIAVLEMLTVAGAAADNPIVTWGAATADLTTLVALAFTRMDPRGNPTPTSVVSTNPQAAGGQLLIQRTITATTNVDFITYQDGQIPILPGQAVDIQSAIANTVLNVSIMWRERALELSELT